MVVSGAGRVYLVGGGPGDPGLITIRGVECLEMADVVVFDRLINRSLLAHAYQAEWIDAGKRPDHHVVPQEEINALLIREAKAGKTVVRLKGGDPFVFGRGGEEAAALAEAGIPYEIVPGVTSAIAGPAYAGIPITHREVACSAAVITGHRAGCTAEEDWRRMAGGADTLVFLMGVKNLPQIAAQLIAGGRSPETPVALVEQASCATQRTATGTLANIVERAAHIQPPAVIIVGEVVALRESLRWFDRPDWRPLHGLRVMNTRPASKTENRMQRACRDRDRDDEDDLFFTRRGCFDAFSQRLSLLGAQVVELPAIEIVPSEDQTGLESVLARFETDPVNGRPPYDWLLFTSANAVDFFFQSFYQHNLDARKLGNMQIAAVGSATGQALQAWHVNADFVPQHFTAAALAEELPAQPGQRVLAPRSDIAPQDLVRDLEARGLRVETVGAYCVRPARAMVGAVDDLLEGRFDVVTFFSPSAVQGLAQMLSGLPGKPLLDEVLGGHPVACIGPSTAEAAAEAGLRVDLIAQPHTLEGMVQALVDQKERYAAG